MDRQLGNHRINLTGIYIGVFAGSIALGAAAGGIMVEGAGIVPMLWTAAALCLTSLLVVLLGPNPRRTLGTRVPHHSA